jgi:hypothetical protein
MTVPSTEPMRGGNHCCRACERHAADRRTCPFCGESVAESTAQRVQLIAGLITALLAPLMLWILACAAPLPQPSVPALPLCASVALAGIVLVPAPRRATWGWSPRAPLLRWLLREATLLATLALAGLAGWSLLPRPGHPGPWLCPVFALLFAAAFHYGRRPHPAAPFRPLGLCRLLLAGALVTAVGAAARLVDPVLLLRTPLAIAAGWSLGLCTLRADAPAAAGFAFVLVPLIIVTT